MIKMLTSVSGEKNGKSFDFVAGQEANVFSDAEEKRFVDRGMAEYVKQPTKKKAAKK